MKITKIEIKHFRAFPGPGVYTFDLSGGKSLLLYGENGSGKSSLHHALDQFFNLDPQAAPFSDLAHLFSKDKAGNDITDGFVTVHFDDNPPSSLTWPQDGNRPTGRYKPCRFLPILKAIRRKSVSSPSLLDHSSSHKSVA